MIGVSNIKEFIKDNVKGRSLDRLKPWRAGRTLPMVGISNDHKLDNKSFAGHGLNAF